MSEIEDKIKLDMWKNAYAKETDIHANTIKQLQQTEYDKQLLEKEIVLLKARIIELETFYNAIIRVEAK